MARVTYEREGATLTIKRDGQLYLRVTENDLVDGRRQTYTVESASGNTYTVTYCGSGDGDPDYIACWKCNCPAGSHGRDCKHLDAVIDHLDHAEDEGPGPDDMPLGWIDPERG